MKVIDNKKHMSYAEALSICGDALEKHEGGEEMFISICEIVQEHFEEYEEE